MNEFDPEKEVRGKYGPLVNFEPGAGFNVAALQFLPLTNSAQLPSWSHFDGVLLQLHFGTPKSSQILGSAVLVAPGIAIGARHVIEEHLPAIEKENLGIGATAIGADGRLDIWDVRHLNMNPATDLAILSLERRSPMPPENTLKTATISTRLPTIGETIMVAGFKAGAERFQHAGPLVRFGGEVLGSIGLVAEQHPEKRDNSLLRWPCFRIDVGTQGGMSGGPAFDEKGQLVGVLCAGMGVGPDDISYVSMIYPALWERILTAWPPGLYAAETSLLDIQGRACAIVGGDKIQRVVTDNGKVKWAYNVWS